MPNQQLSLFATPQEIENIRVEEIERANLESMLEKSDFSPNKKIPINGAFLEDLKKYNPLFKELASAKINVPKHFYDSNFDNIMLRTMDFGAHNGGTSAELFNYCNGLEIAMIMSGSFVRKVTPEDMIFKDKGIERKVNIPYNKRKKSRIDNKGILNESMYDVVSHLMNARGVDKVLKQYQGEWNENQSKSDPDKQTTRYNKLNPFNPDTLKQRLDLFEKELPEEAEKFKERLKTPYIPPQIRAYRGHGNFSTSGNYQGFAVPDTIWGKTARKPVHNLTAYKREVIAFLK